MYQIESGFSSELTELFFDISDHPIFSMLYCSVQIGFRNEIQFYSQKFVLWLLFTFCFENCLLSDNFLGCEKRNLLYIGYICVYVCVSGYLESSRWHTEYRVSNAQTK